ncbi:hypothetical protein CYMTET_34700, partial [Cymbomonas tetramitiformis]
MRFGNEIPKFRVSSANTQHCRIGTICVPCTGTDGYHLPGPFCSQSSESCYGQGVCIPCLRGQECPDGSVSPTQAAITAFSADGVVSDAIVENEAISSYYRFQCPVGHLCPAGTYQLSASTECQAMYVQYLRDLMPSEKIKQDAPSGYYCGSGRSGYSSDAESRLEGCDAGAYCPDASLRVPCPKGRYCKAKFERSIRCRTDRRDGCDSEETSQPAVNALQVIFSALALIIFTVASAGMNVYFDSAGDEKARNFAKKIADSSQKLSMIKKVLQGIDLDDLGSTPGGFPIISSPINIKFRNLSLTIGDNMVLNKVCGEYRAGRMVAVMGPSGCGKSTLLNTLCGKATYGERTGKVTINKKKADVTLLKSVMGFVPQDDTVYGDLTVLENLVMSARLRLPAKSSSEKLKSLVQGVVEVLQLTHIQASIVGTVLKRGISGGQKKRVNIGVEMVTEPYVLFLDEPTSGLGATDTLVTMKALHSLARTQRTIVAVIHQPRYQVFLLFHDIHLLYPGGWDVYFGPAKTTEPYFNALGFVTPSAENPADFFLDIISGTITHVNIPGFHSKDLCQWWRQFVMAHDGRLTGWLLSM